MAYSLTYSYNSTNKAYSVQRGANITTSDKVVIPATYNGTNGEHPVTSISSGAFSQCTSLTSIIIPNSITSIGSGAFSQCTALASVHLPNKITIIDEGTFSQCSNLTNVHIPNSVTTIRQSAFEFCSSLTSVTIPDSVTDIELNTFYRCSSLTQLILLPSTPPTMSSEAIPTTIQSIYVQQSSKAAYKAAPNWRTFASKIISDDMYLSLAQFNQKNKEYINEKFDYLNTSFANFNTLLGQKIEVSESGTSYVRFSDGTQLCFGHTSATTASNAINVPLPKPFINNSYGLSVTIVYNGTNWTSGTYIYEKSKTSFKYYKYSGTSASMTWVAVGRWKN